ncbi:RluA family pseudouridine synthase [Nitratidesulfovibrio liaohensis]|uniref:RluA family pseudouridine synthase n=1 Tax=Nitratidesulfovibrio liaohensis TaxID=2604158 RepID=A0ABY9QYX9_9BACT|nr:RluA family pseudouridine synthase [Nitratidesulfovibrio liaohensis]WMW64261.1 RluA family pseudouridine synthase [Nitratidesulfovibrio liaohensis]
MAEPLVVTAAEAGQKLVQYLHRRCGAPQSAIQRWVRTGQVRINGGRCKPFDRVAEGDVVRVPPFALAGAQDVDTVTDGASRHSPGTGSGKDMAGKSAVPPQSLPPLPSPPPIVGEAEGLLVLLKPAGMAVQPGTGHADCVTARLAARYAGADFLPTPAHRLDRDTSGLLLVATSYARLRALSDAFAAREGLVKEYLARVAGRWPHDGALTLRDRLEKQGTPGHQKVRRVGGNGAASRAVMSDGHDSHAADGDAAGRHAACTVTPLRRGDAASLLLVRLHTGRTHQIRVQLAERGHPIVGDRKYGGPACALGMLLHAVRLTLPDGERFTALPDWTGRWQVDDEELSDAPAVADSPHP